MADIEKVIKGLEHCVGYSNSCFECPYSDDGYSASVHCKVQVDRDALELLKEQQDLGTELTNAVELIHKKNERIEKLLKEQEAVEPEWKGGTPFCGNCGHRLQKKNRNAVEIKCSLCGRSVK